MTAELLRWLITKQDVNIWRCEAWSKEDCIQWIYERTDRKMLRKWQGCEIILGQFYTEMC